MHVVMGKGRRVPLGHVHRAVHVVHEDVVLDRRPVADPQRAPVAVQEDAVADGDVGIEEPDVLPGVGAVSLWDQFLVWLLDVETYGADMVFWSVPFAACSGVLCAACIVWLKKRLQAA